jgi:hypothetical protein
LIRHALLLRDSLGDDRRAELDRLIRRLETESILTGDGK